MAEYLIRFDDEWVGAHTPEELRAKGVAGRAVLAEMEAARVFVYSNGGLSRSTAVCSVEVDDGRPVFRDGPLAQTDQHLGGLAVVDVADDGSARYWAGRIALAAGWPQEVHRFPDRSSDEARCS